MKLFGDQLIADAWTSFCQELERRGTDILDEDLPQLDKLEGLRHLTRIARQRLEWDLEAADPDFPLIFSPAGETIKAAYDCPDYIYRMASVSGTNVYRIRGVMGDADLLTFLTFGAPDDAGSSSSLVVTGMLETPDIAIDANGRFEIVVSQEEHEGNWLPMHWRTSQLQIRDVVHDRKSQRPAHLVIEPIRSARPMLDPLTGRTLVRRLEAVHKEFVDWVTRGRTFTEMVRTQAPDDGVLVRTPEDGSNGAYPAQTYAYGFWKLGPDEARVLEFTPPECDFWNVHLCNIWAESLDWVHARTSLNDRTVDAAPDGSVRLVIARRDPGVANWLDATGHASGTIVFRFLHPHSQPQVSAATVRLDDLRAD